MATTLFGVPLQVILGQVLLGLINGSFYATLSLGLAVIFGLLNVINFAHGAQYMMGAFVSWMLLNYAGIGFWPALLLAPLIVGLIGILLEKLFIARLYQLDHLYGLLLTFGLALIIQGLFRNQYGISGLPYSIPPALSGAWNLGFMFLPVYRGFVVALSLVVCLATWLVIEKTKLGSYLRAATENSAARRGLRRQRAAPDDPHLRLRRRPGGPGRRARRASLFSQSQHGSRHHHRRIRRGGDRRYGLDPWLDHYRFRAGRHRGFDQGLLS